MSLPENSYGKFNIGDLFFGLEGKANHYAITYPGFENAAPQTHVSTINHYAITKAELSLRKEVHTSGITEPERQQEFFQSIERNPKYKSVLRAEPFIDDRENPETGELQKIVTYNRPHQLFKRHAKAGLSWAAESNTPVHFILDGIKMSEVTQKTLRPVPPNNKLFPPITGSELRWIYRNRNDPRVRNVVQFWHHGKHVAPPWETDPNLWSQYTPTSLFHEAI